MRAVWWVLGTYVVVMLFMGLWWLGEKVKSMEIIGYETFDRYEGERWVIERYGEKYEVEKLEKNEFDKKDLGAKIAKECVGYYKKKNKGNGLVKNNKIVFKARNKGSKYIYCVEVRSASWDKEGYRDIEEYEWETYRLEEK